MLVPAHLSVFKIIICTHDVGDHIIVTSLCFHSSVQVSTCCRSSMSSELSEPRQKLYGCGWYMVCIALAGGIHDLSCSEVKILKNIVVRKWGAIL